MARTNIKQYESQSNDWRTPPEIYQPILDFIGLYEFNTDVCCNGFNIPSAYYIRKDGVYRFNGLKVEDNNGLQAKWFGSCWMNPPYGKDLALFVKKAFEESQKNCEVWSILPSRPENKYYHDYIFKADNTFWVMLQGKQGFINPDKPDSPICPTLPCMIVYWGANAKEYAKKWNENPPLAGMAMRIV